MLKFLSRVFGQPRESTPEGMPEPPDFPFPLEFVPGRRALEERESRLDGKTTPILMGDAEDIDLLRDLIETAETTPEEIIAQAEAFDIDAWLKEREKEDPEFYTAMSGPWPSLPQKGIELTVHLASLGIKPKQKVLIGNIPTPRAWEVPALLRLGGWNDCPEPHVHVALHRRWSERFGATIACVTNDVIECTVDRPPSTREEALKLAREQFLYCTDIVNQGVGTIETLASILLKSRNWYFWWD